MKTQNSKSKTCPEQGRKGRRTQNRDGKVVIVSGPSGVGKSTICRKVTERLSDVYLGISLTTRPKAENEVDGSDYWFVSKDQFHDKIRNSLLLEYAEVFGNLYGTPKDKVEEALAAGKTVILEIDFQGAIQVKRIYKDAKMVFIFPPSQSELVGRLKNRGRENAEMAEKRLDQADDEIAAAWKYYKHMVINGDLDQAVNEVIQIIQQGDKE